MTPEQIAVIGLIVVMFALFAWNKWRYDVMAVLGLSSLVVLDAVLGGAANQICREFQSGSGRVWSSAFGHADRHPSRNTA